MARLPRRAVADFDGRVVHQMTDSSSGGGGCGCLSIVLFVILMWALCFGVTVGGHHYGFDMSCEKGVEVQK